MELPLMVTVRLGASVSAKVWSTPTPMPWEALMLLATIILLLIVAVMVVCPKPEQVIAVPFTLVSGLATVPLPETSKLPWPLPLTATSMALAAIWLGELWPATRLAEMVMMAVPLPAVPQTPAGPEALEL